jgi:hypothetical protein
MRRHSALVPSAGMFLVIGLAVMTITVRAQAPAGERSGL